MSHSAALAQAGTRWLWVLLQVRLGCRHEQHGASAVQTRSGGAILFAPSAAGRNVRRHHRLHFGRSLCEGHVCTARQWWLSWGAVRGPPDRRPARRSPFIGDGSAATWIGALLRRNVNARQPGFHRTQRRGAPVHEWPVSRPVHLSSRLAVGDATHRRCTRTHAEFGPLNSLPHV